MERNRNEKTPKASPRQFVKTAGLNPQAAQMARVRNHFYISDKLGDVSNVAADAVAVVNFPCGDYVYRNFGISISNTAAIAGETIATDGIHRINSANLNKYVESVSLEINGTVEATWTTEEFRDLNELFLHNQTDGFLIWSFGAPGQFRNDFAAEDAYALGTADIRSLRLRFKLRAAWLSTMRIRVVSEYARAMQNIGWLITNRDVRYTAAGAGDFLVSDIQAGTDMAAIWVRGTNGTAINAFKFTADDVVMLDATASQYQAMGELWGKDHSQLAGGNLYLDFWREGDPNKAVAALASRGQIRARADFRLTLNFAAAGAEFKVITLRCGLYALQR